VPSHPRRARAASLRRRVPAPLRDVARRATALRTGGAVAPASGLAPPGRFDEWLRPNDDVLAPIEAACAAGGGPERFALFRGLDADLWALLLTQQFDAYPAIRAVLPDVPDPSLQAIWNGTSGVALAAQGAAFYRRLTARFTEHGDVALHRARVLDFGCGWGRLTRMLARDVAPGMLFGCDPAQLVLDVCRATGVPATVARSELVPDSVPFEGSFDLAFAFSVFTHLSETAHERSLLALHGALRPGAILVVTVRPPGYARASPPLRPVAARLAAGAGYVFVAHEPSARHPQYAGGPMTYGEAVVTLDYVRERWSRWFELVAVDVLLDDLHQIMLTLRRK
jgi:SAM-dependent methyltransferase